MDWNELQQAVIAQFRLPRGRSAHAEDHWERVAKYGLHIATETGADIMVVRLFALLHDSQRFEESYDPEHGPRAARYARRLCGSAFELEPERLELLALACEDHDRGRTSTDLTIGTCWDADRLDLDRVAITPKSAYMSTIPGRKLADLHAYQRQKLVGIAHR